MIQVAAAIIENEEGQILIARRRAGKSQAGMWEFPGGKLEQGESAEMCLKRELAEEMQIEIEPYERYGANSHQYGDVLIQLIAYKARFVRGSIKLIDHDEYRWVRLNELLEYTFAPADVKFVEMLVHEGTDSIVKSTLKQAYNTFAQAREATKLVAWKQEERDVVLSTWKREGINKLLEIGAGPGRDSLFFQQQGLDVLAIDLSDEMVALCQQKGVPARVMDFYQLKFPDHTFDGIYALNCLLHVPKARLVQVLLEIKRVLKPEGQFYLGLYGGDSTDGIWENDSYEPKRYFAMYPDEDILRIVREHFTVLDFHTRSMGEEAPHFQSMMLRNDRF
ncbi:8-oxo-dGTP diphosphatase MutT [Paenibacillus marinisediminis]